jgi:hypothetical protein
MDYSSLHAYLSKKLTDKKLPPCPIQLQEHQKEHVAKIWNLITGKSPLNFSFLETSMTGAGKGYTVLWIAYHLQKLFDIKIFLVAPSDASLNSNDGWLFHAKQYDVKLEVSITYTSLRGARGKVSHKWLVPPKSDKYGKTEKEWQATKHFAELCAHGVFLIFDEFHHAKNASLTHYACAALVKMAKNYPNYCRCALISHTPGDKLDHYPQILRMTGIVTSLKLFKHVPFTSEYLIEGYGLGELLSICKDLILQDKGFSPKEREEHLIKLDSILEKLSKEKCKRIFQELYETHLRKRITFAMPEINMEYKAILQNTFFETDEESLKFLNDGIQLLSGAVGWNAVTQEVDATQNWKLGDIGNSLNLIEKGKLGIIAKYVNNEVRKNPHKKFVICCGEKSIEHHYFLQKMINRPATEKDYILDELRQKSPLWKKLNKDVFGIIKSKLDHIGPHIINGEVSKKRRVELINEFQSQSNKCWCLIISPAIGSESISLHDKVGGRNREMLIIPNYYFTRQVQSCGRINRSGMLSDCKVQIVYSKEAGTETSILNSMIQKSKVAKGFQAEKQKTVFPGQFPFHIEGEKDINLEQELTRLRYL